MMSGEEDINKDRSTKITKQLNAADLLTVTFYVGIAQFDLLLSLLIS